MDWLLKMGVFTIQNLVKFVILVAGVATAWANFNHRIDALESAQLENKTNIEKNADVNKKILNVVCAMSIKLLSNRDEAAKNCEK